MLHSLQLKNGEMNKRVLNKDIKIYSYYYVYRWVDSLNFTP